MSELRVDSVKSKGGGAPNLPKGVTISGIATAATLGATTIDVSNVNVSGVVTSATLNGPLLSTGTPTLGLGVTINSSGVAISGVATAGIVSATTLFGDGTNISGVGATLAPLFYQPDPYDTGVLLDAGIGITFNQQVKAGTGNVTLSIANAGVAGTVVENFGVGSSVSISENRITINPTADLSGGKAQYFISYPSGAFTNNEGTDYVGTGYTFEARAYNYQLWAWGQNTYGQLGDNSVVHKSSPVQIPGTTWGVNVSAGAAQQQTNALFIKTDGTLWAWGYRYYGELGLNQGGPGQVSSPTQIPGTTWAKSSIGFYYSAAIKTDGTLWTWGLNDKGELGQSQAYAQLAARSSPVQVPGTTWSTVSAAMKTTYGIKTDGTLWVWGENGYGELGVNSRTEYSSPVQVPGTTWKEVSAGAWQGLATKTDGTLWTWGWNIYGKLGQNSYGNPTNVSSPVQIPGTTWDKPRANGHYPRAIKTDGTLWVWGTGTQGNLGLNDTINRSSPTQVPGTTWSDAVVGYDGSCIATKTDGTLWSWGYNDIGQIDHNNTTKVSSPIQIGSDTDWSQPFVVNHSSFAIKQS